MRKKSFSFFIFFIFLFLIILIDLPENLPIKIKWGIFNFETKINPLKIDINLFGKRIFKEFKTHFGLDIKGGSRLVFQAKIDDIKKEDKEAAILSAREIIEKRINFYGVNEPNIQTSKIGDDYRIIVELPEITEVEEAVKLIGKTAQLEFKEEASPASKIATSSPLFFNLTKKTGLTGKHVKKAILTFDPTSGKPIVQLNFNEEGAKLFEEITKRNIGKPLGIFIDEMLISAPIVEEVISGGSAVIKGNFSLEEAKKLAISINSGALPISVRLIEQRTIGPTLGEEAVKKSVIGGIVGLLAVILFMVLYYGFLGVIASIGLILYGLISLAFFRAIPVVLTLPGIAGFILSIGMAVDANILIFERIKEEIRKGKSSEIAFRLGFGRAIDAIKDANLTTLLVTFILFNPLGWSIFPQFGLIRGFALTLAIGVITSLFTGVLITKKLIEFFYKKHKI